MWDGCSVRGYGLGLTLTVITGVVPNPNREGWGLGAGTECCCVGGGRVSTKVMAMAAVQDKARVKAKYRGFTATVSSGRADGCFLVELKVWLGLG